MPTLPAWSRETDHLGDYADLDPALLASLRTSTDEDAVVAAVETQLTAIAADQDRQTRHLTTVTPLRRRAQSVEQRAA